MKGLILSGGKGTRLYPLTYTLAKQLVPLANKPVLVRVIETIRDAGVTDIGIVVGDPTADEIMHRIGNGDAFGVKLTYIKQPSPDGLAHAVKISEPFLGDDRFVMFLGDNCIEGGIHTLIRDFADSAWNSQIVLKAVENPRSYGVADLREDGSIRRLIEKPQDPPSNLALVGIHMFDSTIFEAVNAIQPSKRGEYEITDAIQWLIDHKRSVFPYVHGGWWYDTGKPIDMLEANAAVLDELRPDIAPDAEIVNSEVDKRVTIQAGARIINSTIRGPAIIGEHTVIEDSYVGPFTSIYHHVTIKNCEIERSIVLEETSISDLPARLHESLIGRKVTLTRNNTKPNAYKMNLGDNSVVRVD
ncbi:MAG: glucose-1-phosphate thymidylyltransferase [Chloroflexi bacterium]|nr:glucose-1-phosphate thymidylyltransferase [Chloroflexota bacterium]